MRLVEGGGDRALPFSVFRFSRRAPAHAPASVPAPAPASARARASEPGRWPQCAAEFAAATSNVRPRGAQRSQKWIGRLAPSDTVA